MSAHPGPMQILGPILTPEKVESLFLALRY